MQEGNASSLPMISMTSSFCTVRGLATLDDGSTDTPITTETPTANCSNHAAGHARLTIRSGEVGGQSTTLPRPPRHRASDTPGNDDQSY
jgi:hypothetical protein